MIFLQRFNNNYARVILNKSVYNNITTNALNDNGYPILLNSSNQTKVINNIGENNEYDIREINCLENYFYGNHFIKNLESRESNNGFKKLDELNLIDFTIVILSCLAIFSLIFIFRSKISKFLYHFINNEN